MKNWEKITDYLKAAILPILLLVIWQILTQNRWVNTSILPEPLQIWNTLVIMLEDGTLFRHLLASLLRVSQGFLIGGIAGALLGIFIGNSKRLEKYTVAVIGMLRPIPAIAFVPLLIVWFGIGEESKISVIVIGSFWPVLINTIYGIHSVDKKLIEVGKILRKNKLIVLKKIILPSALPVIFTGFRLGIGSAWTCVVTSEMIAASRGVGYIITYARELSKPPLMFVGIISIGLFGLIIDTIILRIQRKLFSWTDIEK